MSDFTDLITRVRQVEQDVGGIRVSLTKVETTLPHLPTTAKLLAVTVGALITVLGIVWGGFIWLLEKFVTAGLLPG